MLYVLFQLIINHLIVSERKFHYVLNAHLMYQHAVL
jgi:hypothetical protein